MCSWSITPFIILCTTFQVCMFLFFFYSMTFTKWNKFLSCSGFQQCILHPGCLPAPHADTGDFPHPEESWTGGAVISDLCCFGNWHHQKTDMMSQHFYKQLSVTQCYFLLLFYMFCTVNWLTEVLTWNIWILQLWSKNTKRKYKHPCAFYFNSTQIKTVSKNSLFSKILCGNRSEVLSCFSLN